MALVLYNTLTRRKAAFEPLDPANVRMYVCGPTVYDFAHIGNARPVIVFDVLYRLLRRLYGAGHVKYVRNITDVDDKINAAAKANGETIRELTERTARAFHEDMAALLALPPDVEPRATEHIAEMIAMTERLIADGHAYVAEGHVLFSVPSMPDYGRLSGRSLDEMIAGARVEVAPYKRDPQDFVLWKPAAPDEPGWESPWGRGRPGWHLECSAMSERHLGETFDIHGGGLDLIFPHHENEIAQSTCAHGGRPFVRWWLHNGFVTVEGEKMSKSLGNFVTVHQLLEGGAEGEAIRLAMLTGHYRDPLDWTRERLRQAKETLDRFYNALADLEDIEVAADEGAEPPAEFLSALLDDLNTPLALSVLHETVRALNLAIQGRKAPQAARLAGEVKAAGALLGILGAPPLEWMQAGFSAAERQRIEALIAERDAARRAKDFARADALRGELTALGVAVKDRRNLPTKWTRAL